MKKLQLLSFLYTLILVTIPFSGVSADAFEALGLTPGVVMLRSSGRAEFIAVRNRLREEGARGLICNPPDFIFGRFPAGFDDDDLEGLAAEFISSESGIVPGMMDPIAEELARRLLSGKPGIAGYAPGEDLGPIDLPVRTAPPELVGATGGERPMKAGRPAENAEGRGITQNAEFLMGSFLVNIVIPESGSGPEDWTDEEISGMLQDVEIGLSVLQQEALWVDLEYTINADLHQRRLPVSIEPIDGFWNYDPIWIDECLENLHEQDYFTSYADTSTEYNTHFFNNEMRAIFDTDWVFTAYVVDASAQACWGACNDEDPFTPCYVAYTIFLGGPFIVVPYPACRFGTGIGFSHIFLHEMGHVFWALDEYASAQQLCTDRSGYLNVENQNSYYIQMGGSEPCGDGYWCIMNNAAVESGIQICQYTLGQLGLGDDNGNSVPDLYEMPPIIEIIEMPGVTSDTTYDGTYLVSAVAKNEAVPNRNPNQQRKIDYAPWLKKGTMQINSGLSESINPSDGTWNSSQENLGLILTEGLEPGENRLRFTVENNVGLSTYDDIYVTFVGIKFYQNTAAVDEEGITVSWKTADEIFGADFILYREDLTARTEAVILDTISGDEYESSGGGRNIYEYYDTGLSIGHLYRYWVTGFFDMVIEGVPRTFSYTSNGVEETAMIPVVGDLMSRIVPNPSSDKVTFTVDVPKSYKDISGGRVSGDRGLVGGPAAVEVTTFVEISVYNIKGQVVRKVLAMPMFGGYFTDSWDGRDKKGNFVSPGVYFLRVKAGGHEAVKKVVILR